nr:DUF2778 domain-containing protein [Burkholderia gladioli]
MKDIGTNTHRADRFALYRNDGKIDDVTVISGIRRAYFRLHPVGRVVPPFLTAVRSRGYGAISNFCFGGTPPMAVFGRS